jgi:hypothetical protein
MAEGNPATITKSHAGKRQWRVGTLSMGTVLVVFGLVLLLSQIKGFSAVELVSAWWPAIMIILGLEILAAHYFSGEEQPPIKYDFLSIFMVLLIGGIALGFYALTSMGLLPAITEAAVSRTYTIHVPEQRFALGSGVKNIVVKGSEYGSGISSLNFQETAADEVVAIAQATVSAESEQEAAALVPKGFLRANTVGDTLFLDFKSAPSGNHFQDPPYVSHTIILPRGRNVQIETTGGSLLKLNINDLEADWAVESPGTVEVAVAGSADFKLEAFARRLGGEGQWVSNNSGADSGSQPSMVKNPDGVIIFERTFEGGVSETQGNASMIFGKGGKKLKINAEEVFVKQL